MQKEITLKVLPSEATDDSALKNLIASALAIDINRITGYHLVKKSIDARHRNIIFQLLLKAFIDEPFYPAEIAPLELKDVQNSKSKVIIIGAGPAGLFAALRLIQLNIKPIILERGKDVRMRRRDLAALNKEGIVDPDSNYCFGEGGAGTYSDGKLYTRSKKRGDIQKILNTFVHFGADENILYEAHPHIGTNKLPQIITAIRNKIIECGGEVIFDKKVTDLFISNDEIQQVITNDGDKLIAGAVILATGHSARDIFHLLNNKKISIHTKPFALGVRVEHPQQLIDSVQYHCSTRNEYLPPASYSLVQQVNGKGVFSFCMCPGGIIAPASTDTNEIVVNGWSPSKRNNPYANSGIVVNVETYDLMAATELSDEEKRSPLSAMLFQQKVEQKAFISGGGKLMAPAQRLVDFTRNVTSSTLPDCSYLPGINSADLRQVLPAFIHTALQNAFTDFGRKMKGYLTNEAVVVATESRTSSPVRIPREKDALNHPQVKNLYPCGEGAGYAGGIVSAAMDGEKVASVIASKIHHL
jgi:hypothetical protein